MKYFLILFFFIIILAVTLFGWFRWRQSSSELVKNPISVITEKPFDKYSFERLRATHFSGDTITIDKKLSETSDSISYLYFSKIDGKRVSGLLNVPKKDGTYPIIIMLRGFVDQEIYQTGIGTQHAGEVLARNGYITVAPDFLGYGESDPAPETSLEDRFVTYTTILNLFASLDRLNPSLHSIKDSSVEADTSKVGLWAHSNGGHIALTVLEISGKPYPTVLWNPVSKPFPFSILFFTDEFDDHGKALRQVIANFERDYNSEKYSQPNYLDWIQAPIQLSQAEKDTAVPWWWSDQLAESLKKKDKEITYFTYPGEDHNFAQGSWSTVISKDIVFYNTHLKK